MKQEPKTIIELVKTMQSSFAFLSEPDLLFIQDSTAEEIQKLFTKAQLKAIAKALEAKGYSKLNEKELTELIQNQIKTEKEKHGMK